MKKKQKFRFQVLRAPSGSWYWRGRPLNGIWYVSSNVIFPTRLAAVQDIGRFMIALDTAQIEIVESEAPR